MGFDERLDSTAEEVEVLRHQIEQHHWFDATRHGDEVRAAAGVQSRPREFLEMRIPASIHARDDQRVRPLGYPRKAALVDELAGHSVVPGF